MQARSVIIIEGLVNLVMTTAKLVVGINTNSSAILGDAFHSLTDLCNNIIAVIALRLSDKPSDEGHHYGHRKFEQLAIFALAVLLAVVAIELLFKAFNSHGESVIHSDLGLNIMLLALVTNIGLTGWQHYWAKRLDSDLLAADAKHTLSDVLTTFAVISGWQLAVNGYGVFDTVIAVVVAIIIFYMAVQLFLSAIPILVDYSQYSPAELRQVVQAVNQVTAVHQVRARSTHEGGSADVTVSVDAELNTVETHDVSEEIERALYKRFGLEDVVVHVEPNSH